MSEGRTNYKVEVPYHGNCPNCHHFHTNKPLSIPQDPSTHLRLHCDTCSYPLLGIGRTSTQTTLASVETQLTNQNTQTCSNRCGDAPILPTLHIDPAPSQEQPRSEPLSAITEASSTHHRSRSASGAGSAGATIDQPAGIEASTIASTHRDHVKLETRSNANIVIPEVPHRKQPRFIRWRNKAKRVIPARLKALLIARRTPHPRTANSAPERVHEEIENNANSISSLSLAVEARILPPIRSGSQSPSLSTAIAAVSPHDQQQVGENQSSSHQKKREKILTKRRERTAAKQADSHIQCDCTRNCRCQQQSDPSFSSTNRRANSLQEVEVPGHSLGNLFTGYGSPLLGIGDHFATDRPTSAGSDSREGVVRRNSRLSTATTAHGSTSSSLSLDTAGRFQGRPASGAHAAPHRQSHR